MADVLTLETYELRPHDIVVTSPEGHYLTGQEIRLVVDGKSGLPFQFRGSTVARIFFASGNDRHYTTSDVWQVQRHPLDNCRACFLYEALAPATPH